MTLDLLDSLARHLFLAEPTNGEIPDYRWEHGHRVYRLGLEIASSEQLPIRRDTLQAACLFHDWGKTQSIPSDADHALWASCHIQSHLESLLSAVELRLVTEAIYWHNKRETSPATLSTEGRILQDADLLDHFGAIEVWLITYRTAGNRGTLSDALNTHQSSHLHQWREYAERHLNFPTSQTAFARRRERCDQFFRLLADESIGHL